MVFRKTWITSSRILPEHSAYQVRQIYTWLITKDNKIPIVSGWRNTYQLPGGKPLASESNKNTIIRELFEETGIKLKNNIKPAFLGYYIVENDHRRTHDPLPTYVQLRFVLNIHQHSKYMPLKAQENIENEDYPMIEARFIELVDVNKYILSMSREEYLTAIKKKRTLF
jgi:8-oxo-dGTP pyrophosphatase MutT (NUDIX family)